MTQKEIKALVSLLDDEDERILVQVSARIKDLGKTALPYLEEQWEESGLNLLLQKRIEDLVNEMQMDSLRERLLHWKNGGGVDLLEGLWIVATYQYPDLTLENLRNEIRKIYFEAWLEFQENLHPNDQIRILNTVIFERMGFSPNTKNFHSTANSMLNQVLESKRGNPISLCCIYMLVAHELGMPVFGVNLPNLFILTYKSERTQFYINVFNRGLVFSKKDIDHYLTQLNLQPQSVFYEPCSNIDIVKRYWNNIGYSFEKLGEKKKVEEIKEIMSLLD